MKPVEAKGHKRMTDCKHGRFWVRFLLEGMIYLIVVGNHLPLKGPTFEYVSTLTIFTTY